MSLNGAIVCLGSDQLTCLFASCLLHGRHLLIDLQYIGHRAHRRDAKLVDLWMTLGVVTLDVRELSRLAKRREIPIQIPQPPMQLRIPRPDVTQITLEVLHIHHVKPHDGREQPHIRLRQPLPHVKRPLLRRPCQIRLRPVQALEQPRHGLFVGALRRREPRLIHAVIDVVVRPRVHRLDSVAEVSGEQVELRRLVAGVVQQVVELGVEHADDLGGFVGDDGRGRLVPERGHGEASVVVGRDGVVEVAEVCDGGVGVEWVGRDVFAGQGGVVGWVDEAPAALAHVVVHAGEGDDGFEALEAADDEGSVGWVGRLAG